MFFETIALLGFVGLLALFILKIYNISQGGTFYKPTFIGIGLILAALFWLFFFIYFSGQINLVETAVTPRGTYTVTTNMYETLTLLLSVVNFIFLINAFLSVIEFFVTISPFKKNRMRRDDDRR